MADNSNDIRVFYSTKSDKIYECFPNKSRKALETSEFNKRERRYSNSEVRIDEEQVELLLDTISKSDENSNLLKSCSGTVDLCFKYGIIDDKVYNDYKDKVKQ